MKEYNEFVDLMITVSKHMAIQNPHKFTPSAAKAMALDKGIRDIAALINEAAMEGLFEVSVPQLSQSQLEWLARQKFAVQQTGREFRISWE